MLMGLAQCKALRSYTCFCTWLVMWRAKSRCTTFPSNSLPRQNPFSITPLHQPPNHNPMHPPPPSLPQTPRPQPSRPHIFTARRDPKRRAAPSALSRRKPHTPSPRRNTPEREYTPCQTKSSLCMQHVRCEWGVMGRFEYEVFVG